MRLKINKINNFEETTIRYDNRVIGGFTLVETLIAVAIISMSLIGPLAISSQALKAAYFSKDQLTATALAQDAVEYIRNIRDKNVLNNSASNPVYWLAGLGAVPSGSPDCTTSKGCIVDTFANTVQQNNVAFPYISGGTPLKYDATAGLYGYTSGTATKFYRAFSLSAVNANEEKVTVTVTWQNSYTSTVLNQSVTLTEDLLNW